MKRLKTVRCILPGYFLIDVPYTDIGEEVVNYIQKWYEARAIINGGCFSNIPFYLTTITSLSILYSYPFLIIILFFQENLSSEPCRFWHVEAFSALFLMTESYMLILPVLKSSCTGLSMAATDSPTAILNSP